MLRIFIAAAFATLTWPWSSVTRAGPNEDAVRQVLHTTFDRADAPLFVEPVVVVNDHAIAGWIQGDMGGRALLRQRNGTWSLVLCSGDGIKSAEALRQAGVRPAEAPLLAQQLEQAERKLAPTHLAQLGKFDGLVMMDAAPNVRH